MKKECEHFKQPRFSLRKLSVGIVSAMIGLSFFNTTDTFSVTVQAESIVTEPAIVHNQTEIHYISGDIDELASTYQLHHFIPDQTRLESNQAYYFIYEPLSFGQRLPDTGSVPISTLFLIGGGLLSLGIITLRTERRHGKVWTIVLLMSSAGVSTISATALFSEIAPVDNLDIEWGFTYPKEIDGYRFTGYYYTQPLSEELPVLSDRTMAEAKEQLVNLMVDEPIIGGENKESSALSTTSSDEKNVQKSVSEVTTKITGNINAGLETVDDDKKAPIVDISEVGSDSQSALPVDEDEFNKKEILSPSLSKVLETVENPEPIYEEIEFPAEVEVPEAEAPELIYEEIEFSVEPGKLDYPEFVYPEVEFPESVEMPDSPDYPELSELSELSELPVHIIEYGTKITTTTEPISFEITYIDDPELYEDETYEVTAGIPGQRQVETVLETIDGEVTGRVISRNSTILTSPQDQVIARGTKPIKGTVVEETEIITDIDVIEVDDPTMFRGETDITEGEPGRKTITTTYITIKGEKTDEVLEQSEVITKESTPKIIKRGTKLSLPTLTRTVLDAQELTRTVQLAYTLDNPMNLNVTAKVQVKQGEDIVKTIDITDFSQVEVSGLDYYTPYTLETHLSYIVNGESKDEVAHSEPVTLSLKKIELKSIEGTTLVKREANGELIELSQLREAPEDVSNYFVKAKMTHLKDVVMPVESIEEVTIDGQNVYEVTARAAELVHKVDGAYKEGTVLYVNKYQAPHGEVYYDFGDLIKAMQANPGGAFELGRTISARDVEKLGHKSYLPGEFTGRLTGTRNGKRYSITDLKHPLFDRISGGTVQDIDFKNVHIVYPDSNDGDNIATVARELKNRGVIENVNITGYIEGRDNVSGFVNYVNSQSRIENVSFQGRIKSMGGNSVSGGIAGENREALVTRAYVDAQMDMHRSNDSSLLVAIVISNPNGSSAETWGKVSHSVVKGHIRANIRNKLAAIATSAWGYGNVEEVVSYATVQNGHELFGSDEQLTNSDSQYQYVRNLYGVLDVSSGTIQGEDERFERLSTEEANKKVADYSITAMSLISQGTPAEELNRRDSYEGTQGYQAQHAGLYQVVEKLQPFYNREWIVKEANQLATTGKVPNWLGNKTIQAIVPMKDKQFVMDSGEMNRVMLHFTDGTKVEYGLSNGQSFGDTGIREYTIDELGIRYTPNRLVTQYDDIVNSLSDELKQVELYTPDMYQLLKINEDTDEKKEKRVKRLFLDEVFAQTKENVPSLLEKLIQNHMIQLGHSEPIKQSLLDRILSHKKEILLGLTYLNRYYGINFGEYNIKELMTFMPEFYSGQGGSLIDRLIKLGSSSEYHLSGQRTHEFFNRHFSQGVGGNLLQFLNYNRKLLTDFSNMNDWFADATKDTIHLIERQSLLKEIQDKQAKYRAYDNLSHRYYHKMILPLLNLREAKMFLISTYSTLTFGSEAKRNLSTEQLINEIDKSGDRKRDFLDAWYTLANEETKNRLIKDRATPTWEGFGVHGRGWINQFGYDDKGQPYAPSREFYNVIGEHYGNNGYGAYANGTLINFVAYDYLGEGGHSIWTHEMTHNHDGAVFLGGPGRRSGVGAEAYASGMLQVPAENAGYGGLGINLTFSRPQDGNQIYNNDPKRFKSQEMFDRYMRGYNDALMMLDYLEGEAAINEGQPTMKHWFKKMDKKLRRNGQIDHVRQLNDQDWSSMTIESVDDLVDHQLMTQHGLGDGTYNMSNDWGTYVTIDYLGGIYGGGDNSTGAPGAAMFKHNTFRIWGYYGYEQGFVGYASNKYKGASNNEGHAELSDNFAMQQISNGAHQSIESFKKAYFAEVMNNLKTQGMIDIDIDAVQYNSYESLAEKFTQTVQADMQAKNHNRTRDFKEKLFKALLYKTDNFQSSIFKR